MVLYSLLGINWNFGAPAGEKKEPSTLITINLLTSDRRVFYPEGGGIRFL
jgi:hypothetical protein